MLVTLSWLYLLVNVVDNFFSFIYSMEVKMIENKTKKEDWKARFAFKDLNKLI